MDEKALKKVVNNWVKANEAKNKASRQIEELEAEMKKHIADNNNEVGVLANKVLAYKKSSPDSIVPKTDRLDETHCLAALMAALDGTDFVQKKLDKTAICKAQSTPSVKKALKTAKCKILEGKEGIYFKSVK